jgi:hypothetical protein
MSGTMNVLKSAQDLGSAERDTRMTSLLIRALESAPNKMHTVAELYKRLVELNPSLAQRSTDWQVSQRTSVAMMINE